MRKILSKILALAIMALCTQHGFSQPLNPNRLNPAQLPLNYWQPTAEHSLVFSLLDSILLCQYFKDNIEQFSTYALGTRYHNNSPLGEGLMAYPDNDPFFNFQAVDCMTFVEQILALSISTDAAPFEQTLLDLRYRDGIPLFERRNHYIVADWLPNNSWFLQNVTVLIGDSLCKSMSKSIDRNTLLRRNGYRGTASPSIQKYTIQYIPKQHLRTISPLLETSDIICEITHRPGIFVSHLGLIIRDANNEVQYRNASIWSKKVIDQPFPVLIRRLLKKPHIAGAIILRIRI